MQVIIVLTIYKMTTCTLPTTCIFPLLLILFSFTCAVLDCVGWGVRGQGHDNLGEGGEEMYVKWKKRGVKWDF